MDELPFKKGDRANTGFQYLEDISTAYWYSEILFTAIELSIFDHIGKNGKTVEGLASILSCDIDMLHRLMKTVEGLGLVCRDKDMWFNSQAASRFLVSSSSEYLGHFILYRKFIKDQWQELSARMISGKPAFAGIGEDDADERFYNYLRATDSLIKVKCAEILEMVNRFNWRFPVLDVGGGAGSLLRGIIKTGKEKPDKRKINNISASTLFELDDVISAARRLYPYETDWQDFRTIEGDFRSHEFGNDEKFGLIILSNFLHAYGTSEACKLLKKACGLLRNDGIILIHDYFPDRVAGFTQKGRLYDLNMMLNTYNGRCHESKEVTGWLKQENMIFTGVFDLKSDTSVIVAHGMGNDSGPAGTTRDDLYEKILYQALEKGFVRAVPVTTDKIITASWTDLKCRFGCENYNINLKCPPHGLELNRTRELLSEYSHALILEGEPPGRDFHNRLLALEKNAFLQGYYRAFAFTAGPCPVCPECPESGECRNTKLARPSMEGSGIDVYATCRAAGITLAPVSEKNGYIKYIGLLLLG